MYRLLSFKPVNSVKGIKLALGAQNKKYPHGIDRKCIACTDVPKAVFCHLVQRQTPMQATTILNVNRNVEPDAAVAARQQSTISTNVGIEPTKGKKRKRKFNVAKYIDLLEVTEAAANERKSRVKRLKAKKLQDFISKTQAQIMEKKAKGNKTIDAVSQPIEFQKINMDALETAIFDPSFYDDRPLIFFNKKQHSTVVNNPGEVMKILKSYHNYRDIIESLENERYETDIAMNTIGSNSMADFDVGEQKIAEHGDELDPLEGLEPYIQPKDVQRANNKREIETTATTKTQPRYKSKRHCSEEHEHLAKERSMRLNLNSYLHVCVSTGSLNSALSTLLMYRSRAAKKSKPYNRTSLLTIDLYNILLHGYAHNGSYDRMQHCFQLIEEDGLIFNEQTFAAIFECLGRLEATNENVDTIKYHIEQAEKMGCTLNEIMDRSQFVADQREIALDAIKRVHADFTPVYTPPVLGYDNVLLNSFNDITLIGANKATTNDQTLPTTMNSRQGYRQNELENMAREQLQIELDGCITIKSIEKTKEFANAEFCREKLKELEALWRPQICAAIARDLNTLRAQVRFKPSGYMNYYTYLRTLDTGVYADILLQEIYRLAEGSETFSPTVGQLYRELGQKVNRRYLIEQKKSNGVLKKVGEIYSSYCSQWELPTNSSDNTRQTWQRLVHDARNTGPSMDINTETWPLSAVTGIGRFLYNILMRDVKIDSHIMRQKGKSKQPNLLPAFYTLFRNQGRLVKEEVKSHPILARLLRASRQQTLTFDSHLVPMLCPPQPWSTPYNGGYLLNKSDLIRLPHQAVQQWERINAVNPPSLYPALDSLNQLASIPWRVNTSVLDIIIEVFQRGGDSKLDVPQPPSSLPPLPTIHEKDATISNAQRSKLFRQKLHHRRQQAEMYSLWCDTLYRLSLANHYRNKVFWLPHNMDFRGRVYPVPPHLNHLGSDLARSLLVFNQAQPLGPDGFSWLKLHCINLTGLKKRDSVQERLLYAEEIMPEILDSADNPLNGRMWWAKSDEPWQTLACCIEIANVLRSENPEAYMSHFPIHQDGSCNGLQHYAALGRDEAGAHSVNLAPSAVPQDVYSSVAALVEKTRKTDASNGLHVAQALDGFVRRKVIKQTVMTTVYGVTRYGARLQIARQLKDIDDFPKDWVWPASTYLTMKTFDSLREMFTSTREIQDWFTDCARLISGVCAKNVEWVTPLGLPVVQPYNRLDMKPNNVRVGSRVAESMAMDMFERPNVMKQKNAFPPNFIHSLDSSHMMLTSLHCERKGLTFVSVHDCFWTHACTVPDLNRICREQFVALHSQPILEDLSKFLREQYSFKEADFSNDGSTEDLSRHQLNRVLGEMPEKGDFDLKKVLKSVYFFS